MNGAENQDLEVAAKMYAMISQETFNKPQTSTNEEGSKTQGSQFGRTMPRNVYQHKVDIRHRRATHKSVESNPLQINTVKLENREENPGTKRDKVGRKVAVKDRAADPSIYKLSADSTEVYQDPSDAGHTEHQHTPANDKRRPRTKNVFMRGKREDQILVQNQKQQPAQVQQSVQGMKAIS